MNGALEILRRERDDASEQIRVLRGRIRDFDAAIEMLEGHAPADRPSRGAGDLKLSVLSKLTEYGEKGGTPKEVAAALTDGGRQTSDASVSSTLSRLKNDALVANRNGRWFSVAENQVRPNTDTAIKSSTHNEQYFDDDPPF